MARLLGLIGALLLIAPFHVTGSPAMGGYRNELASGQAYDLRSNQENSVDITLFKLGYTLSRLGYNDVAEAAAQLLAKSADRDEANTILDKYSVNEVLALNNYTNNDCTKTEFERREAFCDSLAPKGFQPSGGVDPNNYEQLLGHSDERPPLSDMVAYNLRMYCEGTVEKLKSYCLDLSLRNVGADTAGWLRQLIKRVKRHVSTRNLKGEDEIENAIQEISDSMERSGEPIKQACEHVRKIDMWKLDERPLNYYDLFPEASIRYVRTQLEGQLHALTCEQICKIVVMSSEPEAQ